MKWGLLLPLLLLASLAHAWSWDEDETPVVSTAPVVSSTTVKPEDIMIATPHRIIVYYVGCGRFDSSSERKIQAYEVGTRTNPVGWLLTEHLIGTYFEVDGNVTTAITFHSVGIHKDFKKHFWIEGFTGFGALSKPDDRLGGHFQFSEIGTVGYKQIGISYQHISSAGIYKVNTGRGFFLVNYKF